MFRVGDIFYSTQKGSEWLIWHEIDSIDNGLVEITHYGKDTEMFTNKITEKDVKYCIRKGLLKRA